MPPTTPSGLPPDDLVIGALVSWSGDSGYGVIVSMDQTHIRVRWDDATVPPLFVRANPPIHRVGLSERRVFRLGSDTKFIALSPITSSQAPAWRCVELTQQGAALNVPESQLRPLPVEDPVERFQIGEVGTTPEYLTAEVARRFRHLHDNDDLVSLSQSRVDLKPHQVFVAHRVAHHYPHRFLLCDEVGLGKTIEAGMIMKELIARGSVQRVLVIAPPNLMRQWQFEMSTKFNERFSILNTQTVRHIESEGHRANPFLYADRVLCSSRWITHKRWHEQCVNADWDLVVVDEAHHARSHPGGKTTGLYRVLRDLASPEHFGRRGILLLTATPMQLNTHELYSMVELLSPELFPSEEHFEEHRKTVPGLGRLVQRLDPGYRPAADVAAAETVTEVARWLELDEADVRSKLSGGPDEIDRIARQLAERHRLSEVLIRNRKQVIGGFSPRHASRWPVDLTDREMAAFEAVENYIEHGFRTAEEMRDRTAGFVMVIFQKLAASSVAAVTKSLRRRRETLMTLEQNWPRRGRASLAQMEESLDDDVPAVDVIGGNPGVRERRDAELRLLDAALHLLQAVQVDSKAQVLMDRLAKLFSDKPTEKVIIFTEFRETQRYLADRMAKRGWGVHLFHGQMKPADKEESVTQFREGKRRQVLVSTEAGGEGRNFQFCHILVNYDLPWNPMRVEQRIGRVDRIGQREPVSIFNLWVKGTIEERVLEVLENRINVFEETVGGLDPILGQTETDIRKALRVARARRTAEFRRLGKQVETQLRRARAADSQFRDFITDTKSFRREIAEQVAGRRTPVDQAEFEAFLIHLLKRVGTRVDRVGDKYHLRFRGDFLDAHRRDLFAGGPEVRVVFSAEARAETEDLEFMAFGHPVVDAIMENVRSPTYGGVAGTWRASGGGEIKPASGWLFTYEFSVGGIRRDDELRHLFVVEGGLVDERLGSAVVRRMSQEAGAEAVDPTRIPVEYIDVAKGRAEERAEQIRRELAEQAEREAGGRADQECQRLEAWFAYKKQAARDKADATERTLRRLRASGQESDRRVVPVWESNWQRDRRVVVRLEDEHRRRLAEVERQRHPSVSWALRSVGRIEIE